MGRAAAPRCSRHAQGSPRRNSCTARPRPPRCCGGQTHGGRPDRRWAGERPRARCSTPCPKPRSDPSLGIVLPRALPWPSVHISPLPLDPPPPSVAPHLGPHSPGHLPAPPHSNHTRSLAATAAAVSRAQATWPHPRGGWGPDGGLVAPLSAHLRARSRPTAQRDSNARALRLGAGRCRCRICHLRVYSMSLCMLMPPLHTHVSKPRSRCE